MSFTKGPPAARLTCVLAWAVALTGLMVESGARAQTLEERAEVCTACHGENGIPTEKNIPVIWGQMEGYLYLELRDFKKGARQNEIMTQIVADMDRDTMQELAAYFAAKPFPKLGQPGATEPESTAALTANASIGCSGCHLGEYQGTGTAPRLAGQNRDYLIKTMAEFRSGVRANNPGMTSLMKATSESDMAALANYIAGL